MEIDWLERWADNRIAFHQQNINSRLTGLWDQLNLQPGATVFVPLCGKTRDMVWLRDAGYSVIGNELSDIACRDFFRENHIAYAVSELEHFKCYTAKQIKLLQGDFFNLTAADLPAVSAVFDRASLIALPTGIRRKYAQHLSEVLQTGSKILLISMEYDQAKMKGPPFSVPEEEIREIFSREFTIEVVSQSSGPEIVGSLKDRGLNTLNEKVYLLERQS